LIIIEYQNKVAYNTLTLYLMSVGRLKLRIGCHNYPITIMWNVVQIKTLYQHFIVQICLLCCFNIY